MVIALKTKKREVSQKVWIKDLISGAFTGSVGWSSAYVELAGQKISRVNILATVAARFMSEDGNYGNITLDDGTETIRSKAFGPDVVKLSRAHVGAIVRFVGKIKEYNSERYMKPEIVHVLDDPNWLIVHKLEMGVPASGMPAPGEMKPTVSEEVAVQQIKAEDMGQQAKFVELVRSMDDGSGADMDALVAKSGLEAEDAKNIIVGLLSAGELFEPRKGKLKVLD